VRCDWRRDDGSLQLFLLVLLVTSGLVVVIVGATLSAVQKTRTSAELIAARAAAETALADAVTTLNNNDNNITMPLTGEGVVDGKPVSWSWTLNNRSTAATVVGAGVGTVTAVGQMTAADGSVTSVRLTGDVEGMKVSGGEVNDDGVVEYYPAPGSLNRYAVATTQQMALGGATVTASEDAECDEVSEDHVGGAASLDVVAQAPACAPVLALWDGYSRELLDRCVGSLCENGDITRLYPERLTAQKVDTCTNPKKWYASGPTQLADGCYQAVYFDKDYIQQEPVSVTVTDVVQVSSDVTVSIADEGPASELDVRVADGGDVIVEDGSGATTEVSWVVWAPTSECRGSSATPKAVVVTGSMTCETFTGNSFSTNGEALWQWVFKHDPQLLANGKYGEGSVVWAMTNIRRTTESNQLH